MRRAWREIASYIDLLHLPLFVACMFLGFWVFFFVEWRWRKAEYGRWWWSVPQWLTRGQRQRLEQWHRDAGFGWLVERRRSVGVALLIAFAWPFISPTYCENVVCKGYKGQLKPRTECLPQKTARPDGVRPPKSGTVAQQASEPRCQPRPSPGRSA
jgi:hypothetical protein